MKAHFIFLVVAVLFTSNARAAERLFEPLPVDGQKIEYQDGEAFLIATNQGASVMVSYVARDKKSAWIKVGVYNASPESFNVADTSISVTAKGLPLDVMTYADRIKEQRRMENWGAVAAGLNAAANNMNASNAGYQQHTGTYSGTTNAYGSNGGYGTATTRGTYYGSTYDAGAAQRAQLAANEQNQKIFDRQKANADYARQDIESRALKANTLSPGEFVMGDVRFSLPKRDKQFPAEILVVVDVAGEPIQIIFRERQ